MKKEVLLLAVFIFELVAFSQEKQIKIKEDPINRAIYEYNRLIEPSIRQIPSNIKKKELEFIKNQKTTRKLKGIKATNWVHRGPFNVGGRTRALAIDDNNENIILAGGVSGGIWRSTDGGNSWTKATGNSDLHSATAIAQDTRPSQTNTWYYSTGELIGTAGDAGASFKGNGLFKSVDNGISWSEISSTSSNNPQSFINNFQYCWNVKVNPQNGNLFVATYRMIYVSSDGGDSWNESISGDGATKDARYTDIEISSSGIIYATLSNNDANEGIFRSTDGLFWTNITPVDFPASLERIVLDIAPSNENIVYFLANTPGEGVSNHSLWKYEYVSGDGSGTGGNWTNLSNQIPALGGVTGNFDSNDSYDLMIKAKPNDENFVLIGGINLFRSTNGFATTTNTTWIGGYTPTNDSYESYTNHHEDQHSLVFYPSIPNKVISGHDGGLSRTNDISANIDGEEKVDWISLNTGYLTTQAYTVAIPSVAVTLKKKSSGVDEILSGFQDNGTWSTESTNGTVDWEKQLNGDGSYCAFGINSRYTSSQKGIVYGDFYDSEGNLDYWTRVDPDGATGQLFIHPYIIDPNNTNIMYYPAGDVIWRNSNLTEIPKKSNNPATTNWFSMNNSKTDGSTITALDISKTPANVLFYGSANGKLFKIINASTGDPSPVEITGSNFPAGNIGCVLVNPSDTSEIFTTFTNYKLISIWHSTNGGQNWESISGNLEENPDGTGSGPSVRWISILDLATDSSIYFVGTSTGLFSTTKLDGDNTVWVQEGESIIGNVVVTMVKTREDGKVVIATHANGIYSANYDVDTYISKDKFITTFSAKIYPNPSNGIFNIEIKDDNPGNYLVTIYDMQGKPVYFTQQKNLFSLNQQVNLQKHAKGIYNIEIVKNGRASSFKVILK